MHTTSHDPYRLIWFHHFSKAAGTSIVKAAVQNRESLYPQHANGNPLDSNGRLIPLADMDSAELTGFVDDCQERGVSFVAAEWQAVDYATLARDPRVLLVTCLRNPPDRFLSNYFYAFYSGRTDCPSLELYANSKETFTMHNYYCRILSRLDDAPGTVTEQHFASASAALSLFDPCLIAENTESIRAFQRSVDWSDKILYANRSSFRLGQAMRFIVKGKGHLVSRRLTHRRTLPDADYLSRFNEDHRWDIKLYQKACQICSQQLNAHRKINHGQSPG